ncbi:hopanoid-associated sugar epimerase [Nitrococcus mobilis]|uniref:Dihydrokaempferol 4-reductase n=1 Tax=Nitrococcus mobilis Nb-231 TaxID=314278 RepID=A4BTL0_9GAMM|nr:hopanoid-associated sugar epimerase [Nitrococcus mobilis]EAR20966.1 Dihydrokaempferol 4-reductase [Nitrococcus mobilis Nb-231]
MGPTLLTGASGFVGSAVLRRLQAAGHEVRVLVRPTSSRRNLEGLDVEVFTGDLTQPATLARAVRGCRVLFHAAADYRLWSRDPRALYRSNVEGTRYMLAAALEAGVERVVYTSSVATLGIRSDHVPADEATPATLVDMVGHYKRSKYLAEEEVRRLIRATGLPVVIVNPSTPIGPRDLKPTPTGRMVLDAAAGRMPAYVDTGLNIVHVDDVAHGHLLALEHGQVGERYILGGTNMSLREILIQIAAIVGRPPPKLRLPYSLVLPIAYAAEAWARVSGREPRVNVNGVRMAKKHMYFSSTKAERVLGYSPRPAEAALEDAILWFKEQGYLK